MHVRRIDFDIVEFHHRIELDVAYFGTLSDELAVHLAFGRDIDNKVALKRSLAAEAAALFQSLSLVEPILDLAAGRCMAGTRRNAVFGEFALAQHYLTAAAETTSTANRIQIHAKLLRGLQDRRADGKPAALAGGGEDDQRVVAHFLGASSTIEILLRCRPNQRGADAFHRRAALIRRYL